VKAVTYVVLLLAMAGFGFGVYRIAGTLKADGTHVKKPTSTYAKAMPGKIFVAQGGAIYRFQNGSFTQITGDAGWTQPSSSPDGTQLVAVQRHQNYSDVYLLTDSGRIVRQLTHLQSPSVEANHWAFLPRFSSDGSRVFFAYDDKTPGTYDVDLTILSVPAGGPGRDVVWTVPNQYTGGDTDPVPLHGGGLVYTKYSIDNQDAVHSQVWLTTRPGAGGTALTKPEENCAQPALSPDEKNIAMVCRHGQLQTTELVVATFDPLNLTIGPEVVLVLGQLSASPTFSPDGQTIAFLAPVQPGGTFQLWTVPAAVSPSPSAARPITQNLGLDSMAAPVWDGR
jgi:Tol biopolymer transport system component